MAVMSDLFIEDLCVSDYLFSMLSRSPTRPLQQYMELTSACVAQLIPFFEAVIAQDHERIRKVQEAIVAIENEADVLKTELRLQLLNGMFLPGDRRDLLEVITMQENMANKTKDITGLMLGRNMSIPKALNRRLIKYVKRSVDASLQAQNVINVFYELLESGFRDRETRLVTEMFKALNNIENDTDVLQVEIRTMLFKIENDLPPVDIVFLYQIIQWVGDAADLAQRVGIHLQLMLAKYELVQ